MLCCIFGQYCKFSITITLAILDQTIPHTNEREIVFRLGVGDRDYVLFLVLMIARSYNVVPLFSVGDSRGDSRVKYWRGVLAPHTICIVQLRSLDLYCKHMQIMCNRCWAIDLRIPSQIHGKCHTCRFREELGEPCVVPICSRRYREGRNASSLCKTCSCINVKNVFCSGLISSPVKSCKYGRW